jgi:hypothetical protein
MDCAKEGDARMPMGVEEARELMFQALRRNGWNQVGQLFQIVGEIKAQRSGTNQRLNTSYMGGRQVLERGDETVLVEVIWSLIVQGILVPGFNDSNQGYPFIRLTEYGERCLAEERILPEDPDGYLREFAQAIPAADATIVEYLTESLQCYVRRLYKASAVMLGCASEQAVLLLIESCANSIADARTKQQFEERIAKEQSIYRKFKAFDHRLTAARPQMPRELTESLDSILDGIFDSIRSSRNDAGHPASGGHVSRDVIFSQLRLFLTYCQRIYGLMAWFSANST